MQCARTETWKPPNIISLCGKLPLYVQYMVARVSGLYSLLPLRWRLIFSIRLLIVANSYSIENDFNNPRQLIIKICNASKIQPDKNNLQKLKYWYALSTK